MRPRAHLSRAAETDLLEIWLYVAEDSLRAADRLVTGIQRSCGLLAKTPGAGRLQEDLAPGLRSMPVGKYVVLYRVVTDGIEVARTLSGYRDLCGVFLD